MADLTKIIDETTMKRSITRMAHEILENNTDINNIIIFGIKNKGINIASEIAENIKKITGVKLETIPLDVTNQRDDIANKDKKEEGLPNININDKTVIIVDDVLYTGRTARAALETIFLLGRPKVVQLAALIDRGHRELPIRPDYVGKNVPSSHHERIIVKSEGSEAGVYILRNN